MLTNCAPSTSRDTSRDPLQPRRVSLPSFFKSSEIRVLLPSSSLASMPHASSHLKLPSSSKSNRPGCLQITSYPTEAPRWVQVELGVWVSGKQKALSASHPQVQRFLIEARSVLKLPFSPSDVVFTLAALDVFYKPGDPAHWLFWSDEMKFRTAEVVNRISLHQPPLIRSQVAWNGTPEYLSILANHHGSTWRQVFENEPWYHILVPPKVAAPTRVLNLRKRKTVPGAFREPSISLGNDEPENVDEPPSKRARNRRALSPQRPPHSTRKTQETRGLSEPKKLIPAIPRKPSSHLPTHTQPHTMPANKVPIPDEQSSTATTRQKRQAARSPNITESLSSRESSSPAVNETSSAVSHARNRSTSQASAETLVAINSVGRRSMSVLSASTVVETAGKQKYEAMKCPMAPGQSGKATEGADNELPDDAKIDVSAEGEGMVTRGRASKSRTKSAPSNGTELIAGKSTITRSRPRKIVAKS